MPTCLLIAGAPLTGKSELARQFQEQLGWPLLAKDRFKDQVFTHLGGHDRAWSRKVSALAWDLLLSAAQDLLGAGVSCVVEGNLPAEQARRLETIARAAAAELIEVHCAASPAVRLARARERVERCSRHPGHLDAELLAELTVESEPPAASGAAHFRFDTTEPGSAAALIRAVLARIRVR